MSCFTLHTLEYVFLIIIVVFAAVPEIKAAELRVVNGTTVYPPHKYPWMVSLFFAGCFSSGTCPPPRHHCGGAVLDTHQVLTAAHCCFNDPNDEENVTIKGLYVITAAHERNSLSASSQNLSIAECIIHELYRFPSGHHDVALIRTNGRIVFGDKVAPVNLPSANFDVEMDNAVSAILIGFGLLQGGAIVFPKELQQVDLPLLTTDTCQRVVNQGNDSYVVTDDMLCAGAVGGLTGACSGDSGSPLMVISPGLNTYTQVGITSWIVRPPCGSHLSVFTRLSSYVNWVHQHLQKCQPRTLGTRLVS